jgi:Zn-dependent peptidase ImmA (M78 family)
MMPMTMENPVETLTPGQIIAKYQSQAPVDVVGIANDLGISVWKKSFPDYISGKIFRDPLNGGRSTFSIAVNQSHSFVRQRFTVAHEIAHFLLHRGKLESGELVDYAMYRSGLSSKEETAANRFAADILMPLPLLRKLMDAGIRDPQSLARKLQVSLPTMKIRLGLPIEELQKIV